MADTEVVRRFNRTYTQAIGALDESFLGLGLPLGPARMVFEVGGAADGVTVLELRRRLGEPDYMRRLMTRAFMEEQPSWVQ